jgi:uridine kinase
VRREIGHIDLNHVNAMLHCNPLAEITLAEEKYDMEVGAIAIDIKQNIKKRKIVLISGPSSSGKTTSALKLKEQLESNGIITHAVSLDDFFINRADVKILSNGKPDYENINSLNRELLENCLNSLASGKPTSMPKFDFHAGVRHDDAEILQLKTNEIAVVEGIHALNSEISSHLSQENVLKVYISVRSNYYMNGDIHLTKRQMRMLRRLVRDHKYRGHAPEFTLDMWPGVLAGEKIYIEPFASNADIALDSSFSYEPSGIKPYAVPLLAQLADTKYKHMACELLDRLLDLPDIDPALIPPTSLMREFTEGSIYYDQK